MNWLTDDLENHLLASGPVEVRIRQPGKRMIGRSVFAFAPLAVSKEGWPLLLGPAAARDLHAKLLGDDGSCVRQYADGFLRADEARFDGGPLWDHVFEEDEADRRLVLSTKMELAKWGERARFEFTTMFGVVTVEVSGLVVQRLLDGLEGYIWLLDECEPGIPEWTYTFLPSQGAPI